MSDVKGLSRGDEPSEGLEQRLRDVERSLAEARRELSETQRLAELGSWSWTIATNAGSWSDEHYRLCGVSPQEFEPTFEGFLACVHPDDRHLISQAAGTLLEGTSDEFVLEHRVLWPDGQVRWHRARGRAVRDDQHNAVRVLGTAQDITEERAAERKLQEQRDQLAVLAEVVQATDDAVILTSPDGTIEHWNPGAERLYGYTVEEAVGRHVSFFVSPEMLPLFPQVFAELAERGHARIESIDVHKDGTEVHTAVTISEIRAAGGSVTALVGIGRDITEQKRSEEREREQSRQLTRLAFHDPLTGLANRALLHDRLAQALARRGQHCTDVLLLDLDDFKAINDVSGHAAGDRLLVEVARRLLTCVRPEDTVARLGGDEFAILLLDSDGEAAAQRVQEVLSEPVSIGGRMVVPGASIGLARDDGGTQDPGELMLRADVAMYAAKADGKGCTKTFSAGMADAIRDRADLEAALRQAVDRGEIVVHYQPISDVQAGRVSRLEALVRWQRPQGLVPPLQFLALAESTGVIRQVGAEVLRQALSAQRSWLSEDPQRSIAVNVSAVQLVEADFAQVVLQFLQQTGTRPEQLVLEVTESLFLDPEPQLLGQLTALRDRGVRVSIDDFGTGYSSLSRLQSLPVDSLKIDKSFVDDLQTGQEDLPILTSMIVLAHNLGLDVTAEGVETATQAERLMALGCDYLQGYHFARPASAGELPAATQAADQTIRGVSFSASGGERGQPQVLLIEDERVTRLLVSTSLTSEGWGVHQATTIAEGAGVVSTTVPIDCILVDVNLPDGDGIDFVAALRTRPHLTRTAVIVMTGTANRQTKARAFAAGADDYIVKPMSGPQLIARVRGVMHQSAKSG